MASSHGTPPVFNNKVIAWIDHRLPIFSLHREGISHLPDAAEFQLLLELRRDRHGDAGAHDRHRHRAGDATTRRTSTMAFDSVERIMRDVPSGWLIRYMHMTGASFFFIAVYIHIFRGLYYGSYKAPRELLWILGVVILLLMMATAFMGYVLPWGQMSFWGATVITNLFSAIPVVGNSIVTWLWGGFAVDNPTLNRFFALHYLLPFVIVAVVALHVVALHVHGSNNPLGIDPKGPQDTVPFHPYYTMKDGFGVVVFLIIYAGFVFFVPNCLGDAGQLHPGQSAGDADRRSCRNGTSCRSTRSCAPSPTSWAACWPCSARSRVLFVLPWLDTSPRALVHLPADLQVVHVRAGGRRHRAGRLRRQSAGGPATCRWPRSARSTTSSTSSSCCRSWARSNGRCHCPPASPTRCSRRRRVKDHAQAFPERARGLGHDRLCRPRRRRRCGRIRQRLRGRAASAASSLALRGSVRHLRPRRRPARLSRSTTKSARPAIRCSCWPTAT